MSDEKKLCPDCWHYKSAHSNNGCNVKDCSCKKTGKEHGFW